VDDVDLQPAVFLLPGIEVFDRSTSPTTLTPGGTSVL
jgi:hypothetical protein